MKLYSHMYKTSSLKSCTKFLVILSISKLLPAKYLISIFYEET